MHIVQVLETWGLRAQPRLLEMLVDYWDPNTEDIQLDGMPLRLEVKYIYFIIGLSWKGEVAKLQACGVRQGLPIEDYIYFYFLPYTEKIKIQVLVNSNQILSLKVIALVLVRIEWVASLHQAYRNLMFYSIECMRSIVYDWSTSLLNAMKQ